MLAGDLEQRFQKYHFHNLLTLAKTSEKLRKRTLELGLISSLTIHLFPDCWQFSLTYGQKLNLLTPEATYLRFKKLVEQAHQ